ncbi:MarR family winged helix-turn-helix transcriptional regulator [soil metagenome]
MSKPTRTQVDQLAQALETFTRRFKVAEAAAAADAALNPLDAQTLIYIAENPGCGLSDVARYLGVVLTTMSSAAERLVGRAFVERRRPDTDRRAIALTATDAGQQAVQEQKAGFREACRWMLSALNEDEQAEFIRLTQKIAKYDS